MSLSKTLSFAVVFGNMEVSSACSITQYQKTHSLLIDDMVSACNLRCNEQDRFEKYYI